jgi:hypothetical protein
LVGIGWKSEKKFFNAFNAMTSASKLILFLNLFAFLCQLTVGTVVVALSLRNNEKCQEPLLEFIVVFLVRLLVAFPLLIYFSVLQ